MELQEWAWTLLQSVGGKTKDGEYAWSGWMDVAKFRELLGNATNSFQVVNAFYKLWYQEWNKKAEVELQKALTGAITADQCCDNLIAALPA